MKLSATAVANAKPRPKAYKLADGKGLYLLVQPTGAKLWRYDFRLDDKRRTMALGVYSAAVGLAAARERHGAAYALVEQGIDPVEAQRPKIDPNATLRAVAELWWKAQKRGWSAKVHKQTWARLENDILPTLGRKSVATINSSALLAALQAVEERGALEVTRKIKSHLHGIFAHAIGLGLIEKGKNPITPITENRMLKRQPKSKHHLKLPASKMPAFLHAIDTASEEVDTIDALRLTLLTAVRTGETRFAAVEEFEGLDGDSPLWRLSAARMKMDHEHLVPLSRQVADLVRRRIAMVGGKGLLFRRKTVSGTLSENTMLYALYRMGYHSRLTVHGLRGTFSTIANEAERRDDSGEMVKMWSGDWIERQLAHGELDEVREAYNAAEYLPQRRRMLQWWADWLDSQAELGRMLG
jgi:integrase